MPGIHSERVILLEGVADEIIPSANLAAGMHGFAIMVPPGEGGERFLDMLWRITMLNAARSSWLRSRARIAKMVEAVIRRLVYGTSFSRKHWDMEYEMTDNRRTDPSLTEAKLARVRAAYPDLEISRDPSGIIVMNRKPARADGYADWLLSRRGPISPDIDLEPR